MGRTIWTGMLSFGLVSIPVGLYSATEAQRPSLHQFEEGTGDRIRYQRVNERTGEEVPYSRIVKGADVGDGNFVILSQEELDSVAAGRSKSLEIRTFVDRDEIDAVYFDKTYFLGPGNAEAVKLYALLRDAMRDSGKAAIAEFVMRGKEYLASVRPDGDLLVLETLFYVDEVRDSRAEVDRLPGEIKLSSGEMNMASQLIESMSGPWVPSDFRDDYAERLKGLIDAKKNDEEFRPSDAPPAATNVVDLTAALRASIEAVKSQAGKPATGGRPGKSAGTATATESAVQGSATVPAQRKGAGGAPAKSRAELYEIAKQRDLPGRSSMDRDELARALGES